MAVVYGVLGLIVILTAGTFGTINASPWFNLGIAVLFVVLGLAMFDVLLIDFSRFSSALPARRGEPRQRRAGVHDGRGGGAARRRLRGAGRDPGRALLEQSLRDRHARRARAALRARHRHGDAVAASPAPAWPRCRSRARGWCASSRRSASSSSRPPRTTATSPTRCSRIAGSTPSAVTSSVDEKLKAGWHASLAEGLDRRAARAEAGAHRPLGDVVQELPDDGQDDAGGRGGARRRSSGYVKIKVQAEDPDAPTDEGHHAALQGGRPAHLRDPAPKNEDGGGCAMRVGARVQGSCGS